MSRSLPALFACVVCLPAAVSTAADTAVDFNRDIRPILSNKCFQCHGPDEESREAELRLDLREAATAEESAIVPGKPQASELMARVGNTDPEEVMPPPEVKKPVTERERALLKQWIAEGAGYAGHWSFQPLADAAPPAGENGIDHFVRARLQREGVKPSPEADPRTLIRRMTLDLIGLLPPPDRVERFVAAHARDADAAVAALADELLASPHYGERWGRHWLDQARYADSHGYTIDGERTMWPYRDWVIRAINDDLPFDRFTIEQIAGDLLPGATKAQQVASGFHRNTLINQEGGTDDEQFRNEEVVDRINTTGSVWLGLTLGCAQCHSHKFDPISQKEYYEMFAFFNQGEDVNNTGATVGVAEGEMFLENPEPALVAALDKAKAALAALDKAKAKRQAAWEHALLTGAADNSPGADWKRLQPATFSAAGGAPLTVLEDDSLLAGKGAPRETYRLRLPANGGQPVAAVRLVIIPHPSLPKNGPGRAGNGNIVLTQVEFTRAGKPLVVARAEHDHAQPGFSAAFTIDGKTDTGWAINIGKGTPKGVVMNAEHEAHYVFAEPVAPGGAPIEVVLRHELNDHYNIGRFALEVSATAPRAIHEEKLLTTLRKDPKKRGKDDNKLITAEFDKADTEKRAARAKVAEARKALGLGAEVKTMVMRDRAEKRETFLHIRGDFLRHDTETGPLRPGVPAVFPELPQSENEKAMPDRLDLARWLVRPDHPLTPRVTVNRVWMRFFGKGIVGTENDFGTQGTYPTHPALLDWLARTFVEADGWSLKRLHKRIVTSATYRQSSRARPDPAESHPLNNLLARQNRIRVDAEIVRDAALSASGLLTPKIGGPGVMPPQPEGVYTFTQRKTNWVAAKGPDRYRRAMYTKFIRSAPYPLLTTFDSPDFQGVCTARVRSNTPLQSLAMANDEAMFELARGLAARLLDEVEGADSAANRQRIQRAFALCYSRLPADKEIEAVAAFQRDQLAGFKGDPDAAKAVAPQPSDDPAAAASWTAVARALMNTDEFITRE